ncbi:MULTISPECIES: hypothetical protein [Enterobacterales]|uniref:hypothetical protein n=1 Tax=Enterobacterales TaxID=91347 RepID=UPI001113171B|nr:MULTISPECIES: hypothetical protein [Enterobacterales]MCK9782181.1 hypothetical protein [Proteus columbae]MCT6518518.1 hypothetical protein [Proteus vulgaris]WOO49758.1 hypothetical protein R2S03_20225 [Hafnia alvei]
MKKIREGNENKHTMVVTNDISTEVETNVTKLNDAFYYPFVLLPLYLYKLPARNNPTAHRNSTKTKTY